MKRLKKLHEKLDEYNRNENESWMILIDITRPDFVFIIDADNIEKYPSWWPTNDVAETIEKALELVPKEETYTIKAYGDQGGQVELTGDYTKSQLKEIAELCQ